VGMVGGGYGGSYGGKFEQPMQLEEVGSQVRKGKVLIGLFVVPPFRPHANCRNLLQTVASQLEYPGSSLPVTLHAMLKYAVVKYGVTN
jgi:hypothetical protein